VPQQSERCGGAEQSHERPAAVDTKPGMTLSSDEVIAHCRGLLATYKIPRRVEFFLEELPKTGSGKILKRALRERFWAHQERAVS